MNTTTATTTAPRRLALATGDVVGFLHADDLYAHADVLAHVAAAFEDLGAQRIGEPLVLDASSGDDAATEARNWVKHWATLL